MVWPDPALVVELGLTLERTPLWRTQLVRAVVHRDASLSSCPEGVWVLAGVVVPPLAGPSGIDACGGPTHVAGATYVGACCSC